MATKLDLANAQFIGYYFGKWNGHGITGLIESMGKFLNLCFSDGDLVVKPIDSVEKFMIEGDQLSHCVFTNEYYKKPDSLIFSATVKNELVETIEFSLNDFTVIQARGKGNKQSKFHEPIINLFNSHKHQIACCINS